MRWAGCTISRTLRCRSQSSPAPTSRAAQKRRALAAATTGSTLARRRPSRRCSRVLASTRAEPTATLARTPKQPSRPSRHSTGSRRTALPASSQNRNCCAGGAISKPTWLSPGTGRTLSPRAKSSTSLALRPATWTERNFSTRSRRPLPRGAPRLTAFSTSGACRHPGKPRRRWKSCGARLMGRTRCSSTAPAASSRMLTLASSPSTLQSAGCCRAKTNQSRRRGSSFFRCFSMSSVTASALFIPTIPNRSCRRTTSLSASPSRPGTEQGSKRCTNAPVPAAALAAPLRAPFCRQMTRTPTSRSTRSRST
mmetsp:Transcript_10481/g.22261  ORF Transcript_10481/g.22261 Transcript_10481/m.22261 type:complete len:310 (+) Transcript_10481:946-1875(+)